MSYPETIGLYFVQLLRDMQSATWDNHYSVNHKVDSHKCSTGMKKIKITKLTV